MSALVNAQAHSIFRPIVSWLLCTNNRDNLLYRAIESCLCQTLTDFELIIICNGIDHKKIAEDLQANYREDTRVRIYSTEMSLLNFSLNLGLHMARSSLIARMDADDVADRQRLEKQVEYMLSHPDVAVLGSNYRLIDQEGNVFSCSQLPLSNKAIRASLRYKNPLCHPAVIFRRDVIRKVGGYMGGQNAEDYDLWLRISMNDEYKFANLPDYLLSYNAGTNGLARRSRKAYANASAAQWRNFLLTNKFSWLIGSVITSLKMWFLSNKS